MHVNATGRFVIAAPWGRGPDRPQDHRRHVRGMARHGGGASRQGPDEGRRSASYAARWVAKNGLPPLADRFESRSPTPSAWPTRFRFDRDYGTRRSRTRSSWPHREAFDLRPSRIIEASTCAGHLPAHCPYGHFAGPTTTSRGSGPTRLRHLPTSAASPCRKRRTLGARVRVVLAGAARALALSRPECPSRFSCSR